MGESTLNLYVHSCSWRNRRNQDRRGITSVCRWPDLFANPSYIVDWCPPWKVACRGGRKRPKTFSTLGNALCLGAHENTGCVFKSVSTWQVHTCTHEPTSTSRRVNTAFETLNDIGMLLPGANREALRGPGRGGGGGRGLPQHPQMPPGL